MISLLLVFGLSVGELGNGTGTLWSFRPLRPPTPPSVRHVQWVGARLDRFILAELERAGIPPPEMADRRTLIRRASFDLLGLPPTPKEVELFLTDTSPNAWERLIERLLASPRYGERWGRHWLDVARYADSNGLDENIAHGNAWRYRDWVVHAFNRDHPFDEFIRDQVAGDLIETDDVSRRYERLIATGFLSLGPKVLAEGDTHKLEMDIIDEQIDTIGRSILGLSLGCARCHDHKFDPITTADYYALAGIFKSTRTMETLQRIARWHENALASTEEIRRQDQLRSEIAKTQARIADLSKDNSEKAKAELAECKKRMEQFQSLVTELPTAMGVTEGEVGDVAIHVRGETTSLGRIVPRRLPQSLTVSGQPRIGERESGRRQLAAWLTSTENPLTARVLVNRVWRWHFGEGLVATPDNFGARGATPTNENLLDWLAHRFIQNGWSVKALQREILFSSTYRMSSVATPQARELDPENRLRSRFEVRRLDAESIRDALLSVSGLLKLSMGGSLLHVKNREFLFDHTSKDATSYNSRRRSLYLPVIRNHVYDALSLFDFPDPAVVNGNRSTTTVPSQALFLMNSDFMMHITEALADRLLDNEATDGDRARELWTLAYARKPSPREQRRVAKFVESAVKNLAGDRDGKANRRETWQRICQVVLASNEFFYVR